MTSRKRYKALIERLDKEAQNAPDWYRAKLISLAMLGYAVIGLGLLASFGLAAVLLVYLDQADIPFGLALIPIILLTMLGLAILHAAWIRFVPPEGQSVTEQDVPELWREIERIRLAARVPPLDGVIIDQDFNAAAVYVPDGFWFKPHRHFLRLGLPLLQTLDRQQLATVIAHEFGHFSSEQSRFTLWIHRLRLSWDRLVSALSRQDSVIGWTFALFYRWYARYFDAYSLVFSRSHEYDADRCAARIVDAETVADTLIRINLASHWLQNHYFPETLATAKQQSHPPLGLYRNMVRSLRDFLHGDAPHLVQRLARYAPRPDDTHPTLMQRLQALGFATPPNFSLVTRSQIELSETLIDRLEDCFDREMRETLEPQWHQIRETGQNEQRRLNELNSCSARTPEEDLEYACLVDDYWPGIDALPLYQEALRRLPDHPLAHHRFGAWLLKRDRPDEALPYLTRAVQLDAQIIAPTLQHLEMARLRQVHTASAVAAIDALYAECLKHPHAFTDHDPEDEEDDRFLPHDLDDATLDTLIRLLAGFEKVAAAWIVRKIDPSRSGIKPHYVILLDWRGSVASETASLPLITRHVSRMGQISVFTGTDHTISAKAVKQTARTPFYRKGR